MFWTGRVRQDLRAGRSRELILSIVFFLLQAGLFQDAFACRYNVRETGFVDFGLDRYRLYCLVGADTPSEVRSQLQDIAEQACRDSNVIPEVVAADSGSGLLPPGVKLQSEIEHFPAAVLAAPSGAGLSLDFESASEGLARSFEKLVARVVSSPLRRRIVGKVASSYALVLLFEGSDPERNERAFQVIRDAVGELDRQLEFMPKPIARGPATLRIPPDEASSDRLLLWSLDPNWSDTVEPRAVVLYGRARQLGPVLSGDAINKDLIFRILAVVGADCECGLDPRVLRGTPLPVIWDRGIQGQVAEELGFDPESPMVKLEVSQILRLRSRLWPEAADSSSAHGASAATDDFPVPFVEDMEAEERARPLVRKLAYQLGFLALVIFAGGAAVMVWARRRES